LGFRVYGLRFREGVGMKVWSFWSRVYGLGFRV